MKTIRTWSLGAVLWGASALPGCVTEKELGDGTARLNLPESCPEPVAASPECRPRGDDGSGVAGFVSPEAADAAPCTVLESFYTRTSLDWRDPELREGVTLDVECALPGLDPPSSSQTQGSIQVIGYPPDLVPLIEVGQETLVSWKPGWAGETFLVVRDLDGELLLANVIVGGPGAGLDVSPIEAKILSSLCEPDAMDADADGGFLYFQRYGVAFETDDREEDLVLFEREQGEITVDGRRYAVSVHTANEVLCFSDAWSPDLAVDPGVGNLEYSVVALGESG